MDLHTIGGLREEAAAEGRPLKQLVSLRPEDPLTTAIRKLFNNRCSMAPVLTGPSTGTPCFQHLFSFVRIAPPCCCLHEFDPIIIEDRGICCRSWN